MLAVPLVPMILDATLPERSWNPAESSAEQVTAVTDEGNVVAVETPQGWDALDQGDGAVLRKDGSTVTVEVFDLDQRDPAAVAERIMRLHRVQGITSALDGGTIKSADGALTGDTCVAVTHSETGRCAFLHDGDVLVSVVSVAKPGQPAPPLDQIVQLIRRGQQ
jgi:hypothetical protein